MSDSCAKGVFHEKSDKSATSCQVEDCQFEF
jgi:hypothetical protein